jgi:hypothetical protein
MIRHNNRTIEITMCAKRDVHQSTTGRNTIMDNLVVKPFWS